MTLFMNLDRKAFKSISDSIYTNEFQIGTSDSIQPNIVW